MDSFNSSRVNPEFRDGVNAMRPVEGRKYTMTHSDDTAELFVTIGKKYAKDKIGPLRDEVLLGFERRNNQMQLFGSVLIDSRYMDWDSNIRNEIFLREMPTALKAIRYADRELFEQYPMLDKVPIYIWFQSTDKKYNILYDFGTMQQYVTEEE